MKDIPNSLTSCYLCPRNCGAHRTAGHRGVCGESAVLRVARAALHFWEEPCISGTKGSGAVFFAGCPLHCVYCQNWQISTSPTHDELPSARKSGAKEITVGRLTEIFFELEAQGANNINLVTAGHYAPFVVEAILAAKKQGIGIPFVYNTSGYEKVETLKLFDGLIDIYLPDLKYFDSELAKRYSNAPDYFSVASQALDEMFRQVGRCRFDRKESIIELDDQNIPESRGESCAESYVESRGESCSVSRGESGAESETCLLSKGMIVRHLVLPDNMDNSKHVLEYLYKQFGDDIFISIMNQYTPMKHIFETQFTELKRRLTHNEYDEIIDFAIDMGISNAFVQEDETAAESFVPEFNSEGV